MFAGKVTKGTSSGVFAINFKHIKHVSLLKDKYLLNHKMFALNVLLT